MNISATYRLQLRGPAGTPGAFGFAEAREQLGYLQALGISHVYLSPILTSRPGSPHSYDVVDPTTVNPEFGGIDGLRDFAKAAHEHGIGIIIDVVPNHVGVAEAIENPWWWDVLTFGRESQYAHYFDIDFGHDNGADGKIGLPVLGTAEDVEELTFADVEGEEVLSYYGHAFPIAPGTRRATPQATHEQQHYRLMDWRSGVISYRRFFSVNELAGIRQEDPDVFDHTHTMITQLVEEGIIDGVRVDHPDGLADPFGYLGTLRQRIGDRWLIIEKILSPEEPLDPRLAVDGTTGYDALREFDGAFVHRAAEDSLSMLALKQSGSTWDAQAVEATSQLLKAEVARDELSAEIRRLVRAVRSDNFSTGGEEVSDALLTQTIIDLVARMPVYRADYRSLSRLVATVVADAARRFPKRRAALDVFAAALLAGGEASVRFAQVCGAVMAKGVEDTCFYRACRLVALQEVGGDPGRFGVSAAEFHLLQSERAKLWPRSMTALSTHDTKRSEDVRARIIALTMDASAFQELTDTIHGVLPAPDTAAGHFLLQNVLGVWPANGEVTDELHERVRAYATKAMREAGVHTTWTDPDEHYENAMLDWVRNLMYGPVSSTISEFVAELAANALPISLGRKLLQITAPGIPDVYQGTEFLDDSLVDPDNRREVDYERRAAVLERVCAQPPHHAAEDPDAAKMHVTATALHVRKARPECFAGGTYQALFARGPAEAKLVGFARGNAAGELGVISLAVRSGQRWLDPATWEGTTVTLPDGRWRDQLTGVSVRGTVDCATLLRQFPCCLLVKEVFDGDQ